MFQYIGLSSLLSWVHYNEWESEKETTGMQVGGRTQLY